MNIANKLTLSRIIMVPFFLYFLCSGFTVVSVIIFIAASLTDMLDGYIARKYALITNFGKIMDPLADKILVLSAFIVMIDLGYVYSWMVILIISREFIVAGLRTVAASDGIVIAAGITGKIKTILQMIAIPVLLLNNWPFSIFEVSKQFRFDYIILYACVIMTIISGIEYIYNNREVFLKGGL